MTEPKRDDDTPVTFLEWLGLTDTPDFAKHRFVGGVLSVALSLLLVLALAAAVVALVRSFTATEAGLGTGGLIVALLGAPFLIWSTVLKHQTLRYQKEGHITDRINKAVEQLGAEKTVKVPSADGDKSIERSEPNIEVRIGAILSLERIAQDSTKHDKGRDHVRVMEILCAYVRHNAPRAKDDNGTDAPPQRLDIQKVLDVIKRRGRLGRDIEAQERYRLDLRETDLRGYDLSRGDFVGAVFWRSNFASASFAETDLTATRLEQCVLDSVNFFKAKLHGTNLNFAQVRNSSTFSGLNLANIESVFVEAAILPAQRIPAGSISKFFGSSDTILSKKTQDQMRADIQNGLDIEIEDQGMERLKSIIDQGGSFHHWNPYTINDGAAQFYREMFKEKHNLIGWPFDD